MRRAIGIISLFILVLGCREPFDFDYPEVLNPRVVIDGFISDRPNGHAIRVSYSTTIDDRGFIETQFVENATVIIEDDQGSFTPLSHQASGIYLTAPQYRAQEGRTYRLVVTMPGGEVYRSAPKTLPAPGAATAQLSVSGDTREALVNNSLQEEEGALIKATIDKDNQRHFYQWLVARYFLFESDLGDTFRFCYLRDTDLSRIITLQDNPLDGSGASQYEYELDFIPISAKMEHEFGVEGRLLTMTEDDYNFWDKARRLAENSGGLFDAAPFTLEGNISNRASDELALGYFGVYRETIDRVFFGQSELGFRFRTFPPCTIPPLADRPHPCEDCRLFYAQENYGIIKPEWWGN